MSASSSCLTYNYYTKLLQLSIDNWLNGIPLQVFMYERGILQLGTVCINRLIQCQLPLKKY